MPRTKPTTTPRAGALRTERAREERIAMPEDLALRNALAAFVARLPHDRGIVSNGSTGELLSQLVGLFTATCVDHGIDLALLAKPAPPPAAAAGPVSRK